MPKTSVLDSHQVVKVEIVFPSSDQNILQCGRWPTTISEKPTRNTDKPYIYYYKFLSSAAVVYLWRGCKAPLLALPMYI